MPHPRSQPDCPICAFLTMLKPSVPDEEQAICGECYDLAVFESESGNE